MSGDGRGECLKILGVSRETAERLDRYLALLDKWQKRLNLIGSRTIADVWTRHVLDSGQLALHVAQSGRPAPRRWADLGSGAGFPGLVLAMMGAQDVHLIESDRRKCAFLGQAARAAGVDVTIHAARIETLAPLGADIVTARALAPLGTLIGLASPHLSPEGEMWFLKGADVQEELTRARQCWTFDATLLPSLTSGTGSVVRLRRIAPLARSVRGRDDE
ncbi:MAG: 16S rRNA (guanine(527)-N(7))-methyltransferase RsmG [Rhodothalassiaceae bacterium]